MGFWPISFSLPKPQATVWMPLYTLRTSGLTPESQDHNVTGLQRPALKGCRRSKVTQQIVNIAWRLDTKNIAKLSRWIRCLFSMATVTKIELGEHLLDQVIAIATDAKKVLSPFPFPLPLHQSHNELISSEKQETNALPLRRNRLARNLSLQPRR